MANTGRFALAILGVGVLALAGMAVVISRTGEDGLPVSELGLVEPMPSDPTSAIDDQLRFVFEIFSGTRQFTDADLASRLSDRYTAEYTVDELNAGAAPIVADAAPYDFVRVTERLPGFVTARALSADGSPVNVVVVVETDGFN